VRSMVGYSTETTTKGGHVHFLFLPPSTWHSPSSSNESTRHRSSSHSPIPRRETVSVDLPKYDNQGLYGKTCRTICPSLATGETWHFANRIMAIWTLVLRSAVVGQDEIGCGKCGGANCSRCTQESSLVYLWVWNRFRTGT
jgi:hypothetical protein